MLHLGITQEATASQLPLSLRPNPPLRVQHTGKHHQPLTQISVLLERDFQRDLDPITVPHEGSAFQFKAPAQLLSQQSVPWKGTEHRAEHAERQALAPHHSMNRESLSYYFQLFFCGSSPENEGGYRPLRWEELKLKCPAFALQQKLSVALNSLKATVNCATISVNILVTPLELIIFSSKTLHY